MEKISANQEKEIQKYWDE
jgi:hypothetical protein